ncbi:molybdenum cofactor guanylyltransferase [Hephaestia sp. GCM10023244]|uniref:molybdenum cofactor guanylyltransferase n=1 Tax=unclassified Hephaestia TaxID=2631281 RepID=UPI002076F1A4|nr:molybdenum cofactor guanylyltransferase [Hephaestia sp. MAHUQ-44]MCM8732156.1 molybdenum cofactor guanylyltransferase [Hephaestia sp. MAHUQ-44]
MADTILGAIIAGGAARRFGSDKALADLGGRRLIDHAADALCGAVDALVVCGREMEGGTCLGDRPQPGLGPLGGIAAALDHAHRNGFASVLTIGCDMPRVPGDLMARLIATLPSYCADAPILGHWPASAADALLRHIGPVGEAAGKNPRLSIRGWAEAVGATPIAAATPLVNINTPADLAAL